MRSLGLRGAVALEPLRHGTLVITGGSGFLGINLVRHVLSKGVTEIRSLDLAPFDYPERDKVECLTGDIRDPAAVAMGGPW